MCSEKCVCFVNYFTQLWTEALQILGVWNYLEHFKTGPANFTLHVISGFHNLMVASCYFNNLKIHCFCGLSFTFYIFLDPQNKCFTRSILKIAVNISHYITNTSKNLEYKPWRVLKAKQRFLKLKGLSVEESNICIYQLARLGVLCCNNNIANVKQFSNRLKIHVKPIVQW